MSAAIFLKSSVLKYRRGKRQKDRMGWGQDGTGQDRTDGTATRTLDSSSASLLPAKRDGVTLAAMTLVQ